MDWYTITAEYAYGHRFQMNIRCKSIRQVNEHVVEIDNARLEFESIVKIRKIVDKILV